MNAPARGGLRDILVAFVPIQAAFLWFTYLPGPRKLMGDELRYFSEAYEIAVGGNYHATFVWPPLQSHLLALLIRLFGPTLLPIQLLQIGFLIGGGFVLRALARHVGLSQQAGDLCLMSYLCNPELVAFSHYLWPEISHLFFVLLAALLVARGGRLRSLGGGASLGVALLFKSLVGPFVPMFLLVSAWPRSGRAWSLRAPILVLAGLSVVCGPVVIANGVSHGYWAIAGSAAFNAWVGLNDRSDRNLVGEIVSKEMDRYLASAPEPADRERIYARKVLEKVRSDGVLATLERQAGKQLRRFLRKESFFTDQLPGGAMPTYDDRMTPWTLWAFRAGSYFTYFVILTCSILGMFVTLPTDLWRRTLPLLCFLLYNLAIFLVLHVKTRYRIALMPVLFLYAGIFYDFVAGTLPPAPMVAPRSLAALSVLAFVLWLAFF